MSRALVAYGALALTVAFAPFAQASSLPHVDFGSEPIVGLGFGASQGVNVGGSLAFDVPLGSAFLIGAGLSSTLGGAISYDVHGMYRFIEGGPEGPAVAALIGLWGAPGLSGFRLPGAVAPVVGFGLAYPITDRIDARLNLAYSPFYTYGSESLIFLGGPPLSGLELSYQLTPALEATLGINGRGDFLGLSYRL